MCGGRAGPGWALHATTGAAGLTVAGAGAGAAEARPEVTRAAADEAAAAASNDKRTDLGTASSRGAGGSRLSEVGADATTPHVGRVAAKAEKKPAGFGAGLPVASQSASLSASRYRAALSSAEGAL